MQGEATRSGARRARRRPRDGEAVRDEAPRPDTARGGAFSMTLLAYLWQDSERMFVRTICMSAWRSPGRLLCSMTCCTT